jgi:SAM-dependent methyltransferase
MSGGFSPQWLDLREPADHRSRDAWLANRLARHFAGRDSMTVVDLGCGTGSNLRAAAPHLAPGQGWMLVDYDQKLLDAAVDRLSAWADAATTQDGGLLLAKGDKRISVSFRRADLTHDLDGPLGDSADLVTAAALFDLASPEFVAAFAAAVVRRRAAFYTVLTYNGVQDWTPNHAADEAMAAAFRVHQMGDKGFGPSAGPLAPGLLNAAFDAAGYRVSDGDSPWELGEGDEALIADLSVGFASAVRESGLVPAETIADWLTVRRMEAIVGHTDTLALPPP